jgi:hypothetical protein
MIRMFAWVNKNITFFAYSSTVHSTVHCRKELIFTKMYGDIKVKITNFTIFSVNFLQILKMLEKRGSTRIRYESNHCIQSPNRYNHVLKEEFEEKY